MIGAGVFSAFAAAAAAAGAGLVIGLGIAAVVAFCNATASAQLAATCPTSVVGEEVRDPPRTIPRAITLALGIAVAVYAVVGVAVLATLGSTRLASSAAPLVDAVRAGAWDWAVPVVTIGGATAALGALLALIAGVGRTTLAMARNGDLPRSLASVHPRYRVPHRAEIALAAVVSVLVLTVDLRGAIGR
jgi:APA family basic amino acid/polyamine antiporter